MAENTKPMMKMMKGSPKVTLNPGACQGDKMGPLGSLQTTQYDGPKGSKTEINPSPTNQGMRSGDY